MTATRTLAVGRELIGSRIVTSGGKQLGHVIDLELDPADGFRVTAIELGRFAWLDRLHILRPVLHGKADSEPRTVAWDDVDRLEGRTLVLRTGYSLGEHDA
ncbi:MAG: PRC-barrel domain-containing protein [Candidatus Limnocylindrales bacterium]